MDHGYALHTAAKDCSSSAVSHDVQIPAEKPRAIFYTNENDPAKHSEQHEGRHYSIPLEEVKAVFPHGLPPRFQLQIKTFNEACVMVRKPALELFTYLRNTNFAHPVVRYVICIFYHIKTQQKYVWGKRDSTEQGRPLGEVVEQGITRVKNASDAVGVVLKELKQQCHRGSFRVLVAVDGVNALWGRTTLKKEDKSPVSPEELTLVHNLRKMMMNNWSGGAVVTTLSQTGSLFKPSSAHLPHELLGKEGFDALDPFVPILVPNYTEQEFESCYHYYLHNRWLQHEKARTEDGKEELRFLSGSNPRQLERLSAPL
ncbi:UNVERIFIED_CONTAM: hypothetical protein H355_010751 [Colinus virginianus]|nr:hypothetical protein H355_010751 [Colinus virginianus]